MEGADRNRDVHIAYQQARLARTAAVGGAKSCCSA